MKLALSLVLLALFSTACGSLKKDKKPVYNPVVSFMEADQKFEASVALPKDFKDKVPLVIVVHEWWGRNEYAINRGRMLNKNGYATLVVDMFGNNKTGETPAEAQALATPFYQNAQMGVDRLNKYIALAKNDPHVDASKIFVIGYCFGGTQALNLARSGADIKGVVSFHGGLAAGLKATAIKANILAINGLADPMVPAKERAAFDKEMKDLKANVEVVNYKGALHAFSNPAATEIGKKYNIPVAYNKAADKGSWKKLMTFLKK
jgi:dienelactone hydrolase